MPSELPVHRLGDQIMLGVARAHVVSVDRLGAAFWPLNIRLSSHPGDENIKGTLGVEVQPPNIVQLTPQASPRPDS
jgi:hypothetical protein